MSRDPYEVLGISPNATDDEVKTAYRALARKYHPDHYADNPLSELAEEKMQEINEAYDTIVRARKNGGSRGSADGAGYTRNGYSTGGRYADIRRMIAQNRIADAQTLLDGIPFANRDAEWHFLMGSVLYRKGWLEDARTHFETACRMDPTNGEYQQALGRMNYNRQTGGYRTAGDNGGCNPCDVCTTLYCADCCCECMGGDLIRCC